MSQEAVLTDRGAKPPPVEWATTAWFGTGAAATRLPIGPGARLAEACSRPAVSPASSP